MMFCGYNLKAQDVRDYNFSSFTRGYISESGTSTVFSVDEDDNFSSAISIGFTFNYCGTDYTQFYISTNGFISFANTGSSYLNDISSTTIKPVIAPLWDDLATDVDFGDIGYVLTGSSPNRVLTVEFYYMLWPYNCTGSFVNFQIKLYETSNIIEFCYDDMSTCAGTASIGINDQTGGSNHFLSATPGSTPSVSYATANNSITYSAANFPLNLVYRFTPVISKPSVPNYTLTAQNNSNNRVDINLTEGTNGLIYYLPFEEGSGSTAYDWSSNSNNGSLSSATYTSGNTGNGGAITSNNSTTSTIVTGTTNLPTNTFTYGGWFKTSATHEIDAENNTGTGGVNNQKYAVWPTQRGTSGGTGLSIGTNGISVYEHGDGYMPALAVYSAEIGSGWNHIMVVYSSRIPSIYLNGVLVKTGVVSGRATVYAPYEYAGGSYGAFNGQLDEIKVFNRALTSSEIVSEMYGGIVGKGFVRSTSASGTYVPIKGGSYTSAETTSTPSNISTSISGDYVFDFNVRQSANPAEGWEVSDGIINVDRYSTNIRIHHGGTERLNVYCPTVLNEFENIRVIRKGTYYRVFFDGKFLGEYNYGSTPAVSSMSFINASSGTTTWKEVTLTPIFNSISISDTDAKDATAPSVPTGLAVNVNSDPTKLDVSWTGSSDAGNTYYFSPTSFDAMGNMSNLLDYGTQENNSAVSGNAPGFDGSMKINDSKYIQGFRSGYILKESAGETTSQHNAVTMPDNSIQYRYGGWLYSNGPSVDYFFFSASSTSFYDGTYDAVSSTATSKWELIQGTSTNVVGTDAYLTLRADNNGGSSGAGAVWFDRMFILPTKSVTVTSGMKDYYITGTGTGASTWISGTSQTVTNLTANTQYCYTVKSRDNGDNESAQTASVCKYTRAADVTSFTNSTASCGSIKLDWSGGAYTSVRVYCTTTASDIYTGAATTYTHTGLNPGSYTYRIYAKNADGLENTTYVEQTVSVSVPDASGMSAGDYAWFGGASTEWTTASNWLVYNGTSFAFAGAAPNSSSNVFLKNNGCTSNNATITSAVACNNLAIEYGTLAVSGSNVFTINGNYTNGGTFTKNTSKIVFAGGDASINTGGEGVNTKDFYDVEFNSTGTKTVLTNNIRVSNNLTLTAGTVDLGAARMMNVYGSSITTNGATITCTNSATYQFYFRGVTDKTITGSGGTWNVRFRTENSNITINSGCNLIMNNSNSNIYWYGVGKIFQANGNITGTSGAILYVYNSGNSISTTNASACLKTIYFYQSTGSNTLNINSDLVVSGNIYNNYSNNTLNFNNHDISVGGALYNSQNGTINLGNGAITVTGVVSNGAVAYPSAIFNAGSGVLKIGGNYANNGVFNNGGGTVEINGSVAQAINTGGIGVGKSFFNFIINKTGNIATASNNIEVDGNFTLSAGTWDLSTSNYNMNVAGNWTHTGTSIFTCRSGTVTFDGLNSTITSTSSGAKSFNNLIADDAVTLGSALDVNGSLTINNTKSLSTSASNFAITVAGSWTNNGTFTSGTGTVTFDGAIATTITTGGIGVGKAFYNLTINKSAAGNTVDIGVDDLDINQSFSLTRGTFNANDRTLYVFRNWTTNAANGVFNAGTSTVIFDGNASQTINSGGIGAGKAFNHVTVNKSANTATLASYAIDILGNYTLSAGTWDVSATNYAMYVGGNWTNSATFTPRSGTVYFNGSGAQLITTGGTGVGKPFYNVVVDKSAETATLAGNIDINGSFTITNGTWDVSASNYSMNITGDWTNNGIFNSQLGTVTLDGTIASVNINTGGVGASKAFYNLTINKGDGANAVNLGADNFDINGDFTITRGFFYTTNRDLFSAGNWTVNTVNGFFDAGTSTVTFDGSGAQVITPGGIGANKFFNNVTINKSAGTATLAGAIDINANFVLTSGTWDVSATNYDMNVAGNWTFNGGTFNPRIGTVVFDGSSQMTVDAGSTIFNNLNLSNSAGIVLSSNLNVGNTLAMIQGDITTGLNTLVIGTSAVSVGSLNYVSGKVDGKIKRWYAASTNSGNSTGLFPIAVGLDYRPALVEYTSAPTSGGSLTVQFIQTPMGWQNSGSSPLIPASGGCPEYRITTYSEEGYWKIDNGDGLVGGNYDITLYANGLSTINDLCKLTAVKRVGAGLWVESGTHITPSGTIASPVLKRSGASGWSNWGIAGGGTNQLPVELVRFNAYCSDTEVNLSWVTSSEINNNYFTIERSTNGIDYYSIGQVQGAGNSNQTKEYFLIDNHKPDGIVYYRLKQTDFDGTENVFDPQVVSCRTSKISSNLFVMPNPFKESISINGVINGQCVIEILGSIGENVYSNKSNIDGVLNLQLDFLKPGMYLLRIIETSGEIHLFKIVKN